MLSQFMKTTFTGGKGFITNSLSLTEWKLMMFSIIFCQVSTLDNVKQETAQGEVLLVNS